MKKRYLICLLTLALALLLASCGDKPVDPTPVVDPEPAHNVTISSGETWNVVYVTNTDALVAHTIVTKLEKLGVRVTQVKNTAAPSEHEILVGDTGRPESVTAKEGASAAAEPGDGYYGLYYLNGKIALVASDNNLMNRAAERFYECFGESAVTFAEDLSEKFLYTAAQQRADEEAAAEARAKAKAKADAALLASKDAAWEKRFDHITDPAVNAAIRDLYDFYDPEAIVRWWAGLYDPVTGGFYYANSARDYEGFLPDIESTAQICGVLSTMYGTETSLPEFLGETVTQKMITFLQGMEDPDTGYFIHPQFGKEMTMASVMRYSRDLGNAVDLLEKLGSKPLYPTALDKLKKTSAVFANPVTGEKNIRVTSLVGTAPYRYTPVLLASPQGWESNEQSVRAYVNDLLDTKGAESWSNTLSSQKSQFQAAGVLDYVLDVLDERCNPELGLWVASKNADGSYQNFIGNTESAYGIYTLTYKVLILYNGSTRQFKHWKAMTENAIECILSAKYGIRVTYLYNPWATLTNIRSNLRNRGSAEELAEFDAMLSEHAVDMVNATLTHLGDFKQADGSYSFLPGASSATIYNTPVSLGFPEGDVNGNHIAFIGFTNAICGSLGYDRPQIFNYHHGELFKSIIRSAQPAEKQVLSAEPQTYDFEGLDEESFSTLGGVSRSPAGTTEFHLTDAPGGVSGKSVLILKPSTVSETGGKLSFTVFKRHEADDETALSLSFRIYVSSDTAFAAGADHSNLVFAQIPMSTKNGSFYMAALKFNDKNNPTGFTLIDQKSTSGGASTALSNKVFDFDTWYDFTFEFHITGIGTNTPVFEQAVALEGDKVLGTSKNFYSTTFNKNDANSGDISYGTFTFDTADVKIGFTPLMRIYAKLYLDDITGALVPVRVFTPKAKDLTFEGYEAGEVPEGVTTQTTNYGKAAVDTDPADPENKVLRLIKNTEGNDQGNATTVLLSEKNVLPEGQILRMSMNVYISSDTRYGNAIEGGNLNIIQIRFGTGAGVMYMPMLRFTSDMQHFVVWDQQNTGGGTQTKFDESVFDLNTWYSFTFDFRITGTGSARTFACDIFVDGEKVGTSTNFFSKDGNPFAYADGRFEVVLHPQMRMHADLCFDDFKLETADS